MSQDTILPKRKNDHLRINIEEETGSLLSTGLERYRLVHRALPEINFADVKTTTEFLGTKLGAPLLISSMTGGTERTMVINRRLAAAAQQHRLAIGAGSQRAALEDTSTAKTFSVIREEAPDALVFANLGAVQLNESHGIDSCQRAVDMLQANGLFLHLNPLQEALQEEGDTNFFGLLKKIERVCHTLEVPVLVKEVGWGIDVHSAKLLLNAGVQVIDTAGAGGTSWSEVEKHRTGNPILRRTAEAFKDWGHPTAGLLLSLRSEFPDLPLIASGGIRSGIDAAKCIALGANLVGAARPFLLAAAESDTKTSFELEVFIRQMKTAMFASGCKNLEELTASAVIERIP